MDLKGSVALVTGGSKGIGRGIAEALGTGGARLVIAARGRDDLEATTKDLTDKDIEVEAVSGDVGDENDAARMVRTAVDRFGRLDILVNNAGYGKSAAIEEMDVAEWDDMFRTNVRGVFLMTRNAVPIMKKQQRGAIVNISSLAGKNPVPDMPCYAATKWAVDGLTQSLARKLRGDNIRVILVHPGSTLTSFASHPINEDKKKRMLQPSDIAAMVIQTLQLPDRALASEIDVRPTNP